ncbi:hypothetical protein [Echinicola sp. 20G]|uniref:hypothetical protein n=1 Tax=Echinicola sp. 20G TaxID=2781961 RepID=UPI001910C29F|nr:hypothetical protein [Echinicola sp. 20G]
MLLITIIKFLGTLIGMGIAIGYWVAALIKKNNQKLKRAGWAFLFTFGFLLLSTAAEFLYMYLSGA